MDRIVWMASWTGVAGDTFGASRPEMNSPMVRVPIAIHAPETRERIPAFNLPYLQD
jgi:hypothetical protein